MSSTFGTNLKLSIFGESHGPAVGCCVDSFPPGFEVDMEALQRQMARRAPGQPGAWSTTRKEGDIPEIVSGLFSGRTTGTPLAAIIRNTNTRSSDYSNLSLVPRPGHGDLTGNIRYKGANDPNGGGHFSARVTAPLTFAGAIAMQILAKSGVSVRARIVEIAGIADPTSLDPLSQMPDLSDEPFPVLDSTASAAMQDAIVRARAERDSVGGVVEVRASGLPAGLGSPFFDRVESQLGRMFFSINAVRGVEFGDGFAAARSRGSCNNDPIVRGGDGAITRSSNHAGGAEGGITTGLPIIARIAFKPTPSISLEQDSVNLSTGLPEKLVVKGRHDPCVVPRAVPLVESACAFALLDIAMAHMGLANFLSSHS